MTSTKHHERGLNLCTSLNPSELSSVSHNQTNKKNTVANKFCIPLQWGSCPLCGHGYMPKKKKGKTRLRFLLGFNFLKDFICLYIYMTI